MLFTHPYLFTRPALLTAILILTGTAFAQTASPRLLKVIASAATRQAAGDVAGAVALLKTARAKLPRSVAPADKRAVAVALADAYYRLAANAAKQGDTRAAIAGYDAAYQIDRVYRAKDSAFDLHNIGLVYFSRGEYAKAVPFFERSVPLLRAAKDSKSTATALQNLGLSRSALGQTARAIAAYTAAIPLFHAAGDEASEGETSNALGMEYVGRQQYTLAIPRFEQAISSFQAAKDGSGTGVATGNLGLAYYNLGTFDRAIVFLEQSTVLLHAANDSEREAAVLSNVGMAFLKTGRYTQATARFAASLALYRRIKDVSGTATVLNNLGLCANGRSNYAAAVTYFEQSLPLWKQTENRDGESTTLNNLGQTFYSMGAYPKATLYYNLALDLARAMKNRAIEAATLGNIGLVFFRLQQPEQALPRYEQSLALFRANKDAHGEGIALNNIAGAYGAMGQHEKERQYYAASLEIARTVGNRQAEAATLGNLGGAFYRGGDYDSAARYAAESLAAGRAVGDRQIEAEALTSLMATLADPRNPGANLPLAAFWGKQAVNVKQSVRKDIAALDATTRTAYLETNTETYRALADCLIAQGRLPEAQEVLDILKSAERLDFVAAPATRGNAVLETLAATPTEAKLQSGYEQIAGTVTRLGAAQAAYEARKRGGETLSPTDEATLADTRAKLATASTAFGKFLASLADTFASAGTRRDERTAVAAADDAKAKQTYLAALSARTGSRTVLVNLLVGKTVLYTICTTPTAQTAQSTAISAAELNRLVARFRAVLTNPYVDPRPVAKKLYDVLLKPLENDLAGAGAQTLLVTLDGTVRYVPLAALSPDGETYLLEKYRFVTETGRGFQTAALDAAPAQAKVIGFGVTQAHTVTLADGETVRFGALSGVANELSALPGAGSETRMDNAFTKAAILDGAGAFPVWHIASHFRLGRDDAHSFLLCGDGAALTMEELSAQSGRFAGVDLLLLSACDTATGGILDAGGKSASNGGEVDSFALLAQEQGAQSVMASLWPVSDASTAALLTHFYRERQGGAGTAKTEALRRAQLALLTGASAADSSGTRAAPAAQPDAAPDSDAPPFVPDTKKPWAHPYYWAAFVLMGNAR